MDLIYLDYNCFQRRFDDPSQVREIQDDLKRCYPSCMRPFYQSRLLLKLRQQTCKPGQEIRIGNDDLKSRGLH
jgi:hypothetical protein